MVEAMLDPIQLDEVPANTLNRKKLIDKLKRGLQDPRQHREVIVPSQTWFVYWIGHSLSLVGQQQFLIDNSHQIIKFISECAHEDGGYGGGPGQIPHLATTFAAVNALISLANDEALESIDRVKLVAYVRRMKQPDGSFSMHSDGEIDSRATYCALVVLRCLNIHDSKLFDNVADWILECQTYEGGFGSIPGSEAHGGYTFCCVASLCLLNQLHRANIPALVRWLTNKQLTEDGGFCGRSNKLVDSCYSYWQGAVFLLIHPLIEAEQTLKPDNECDIKETKSESAYNLRTATKSGGSPTDPAIDQCGTTFKPSLDRLRNNWLFDGPSLQDYILNRCQSKQGLLRDKPEATPDFYHTCYALSGLSISQHQPSGEFFDLGSLPINELKPTHPLFNLTPENLDRCFKYFSQRRIEILEED